MFHVGDIVKLSVDNSFIGVVVAVYQKHPASIEILWFKNQTHINYSYTRFDYIIKVS
jgi:hypothetical protein